MKDFIEISEHTPLDDLIHFLEVVRDNLPRNAEPELKIRGDDVFGQRLTIRFLREPTAEELALEEKYASPAEPASDDPIEELRHRLDQVPYKAARKGRAGTGS
ncbi:MAG: hypothetical protein ABI626_02095 [Sphingomicrobium sp.]